MTLETFGLNSGTTTPTTITAPAANNTKGAWTQLVASTSKDFEGIVLFRSATVSGREYLLDIGIGAAGSEQVIIPNLLHSATSGYELYHHQQTYFPLRVPAGSRIAARYQTDNKTSIAYRTCGYGILSTERNANPILANDAITYGADTTNTNGVVLPGVDSNTGYGSWAEITSSTSRAHSLLLPSMGMNFNLAATTGTLQVQIGIGAAGSEIAIGEMFRYRSSSNDTIIESAGPWIPVNLPAGTRIAARCNYGSNGTNASKQIALTVMGV